MTSDPRTEQERLQDGISAYFVPHAPHLAFEQRGGKVHLALITENPRHNQRFLFHQSEGATDIQALEEMLEYIREHRALEPSYTIQWRAFGDAELHTSYFSAPNVLAALDKFFYGRDVHSITVFSVNLNPIS